MNHRGEVVAALNALNFDKPYTMACGLAKLMLDFEVTAGDIYTITQRSTAAWWYERSQLANLSERIGEALDNKTLKYVSALALVKFPVNMQLELFDRAMSLPPDQFIPIANAHFAQMRKGQRIAKQELRGEEPQVVWHVLVACMSLTYEELGQCTHVIREDHQLAKHTDPVELAKAYEEETNGGDTIFKVIGIKRAK